eukprot:10073606-Alexandrium_andersonii.AAC.1
MSCRQISAVRNRPNPEAPSVSAVCRPPGSALHGSLGVTDSELWNGPLGLLGELGPRSTWARFGDHCCSLLCSCPGP